MANFLITTPNSLTQGTDTTDLFVINTALGATVNGGGGADQFSAAATVSNASNAIFAGGAGDDSIYLTAGGALATLARIQILAGNGSDLVAIEGSATNSTIFGGGGNDTINISGGIYIDTTINGNLGSDRISANGGTFTDSFVAAGGDNDTIILSSQLLSTTVNGGGGADLITLFGTASISASLIQGDDPGDALYFGNDTIRIGGSGLALTTVLGGGGADVIQVSAVLASGNRFEGGSGADSISIATLSVASAQVFIGAGAGNDTIVVLSALTNNFGTIQGGGGADVINVSAAGANGGLIYGGEGADLIGLGTISQGLWETGTGPSVAGASGVAVAYSNFSQSNLAGFDIISAAANQLAASGGNTFMVNQSAVTFSAVANGSYGAAGNQITVASGSRVTTFAAGTVSLTARAAAIDAAVSEGGTVVFEVGGLNYLFVQGGSAGSGTDNDLVVQLNVLGFSQVSGNGQGGIYGIDANNLKVAFTNNAVF